MEPAWSFFEVDHAEPTRQLYSIVRRRSWLGVIDKAIEDLNEAIRLSRTARKHFAFGRKPTSKLHTPEAVDVPQASNRLGANTSAVLRGPGRIRGTARSAPIRLRGLFQGDQAAVGRSRPVDGPRHGAVCTGKISRRH